MKIGTCEAVAGQLQRGELRVATDPQVGAITIPIAMARGREAGPTLFFTAGVHGDELNGIVILQRFMEDLRIADLRGTVIFLPLVNSSGFAAGQRQVPYDGKDLNRCFPGDPAGSVSAQIAYTIFTQVIARCDFGVDIHDSGRGSVLLPHPRAHIREADGGYRSARMKPIAVFGTDIIMLCRGMPGVLTIEAGRHLDVPAFTVEVGGAMILWEGFIRRALVGLKNVLIHQGMLPGKMELPERQFILPGEDDVSVQADIDGILYRRVELGQAVNTDQVLAEIRNPITAASQVIRAAHCGVVHDLSVHARIHAGEDVVGVLGFTTCPKRGRRPSARNTETIRNTESDQVRLRRSEVFDEALDLRV